MKENKENNNTLYAPRSFGIFLLQYFSLVPIMMSVILIVLSIVTAGNFFAGLLLSLPFGAIFSLMYFCPQRYRTRLIFDDNKNILQKIKKGAEPQEITLSDIKSIVSKSIKTIPNLKFYLIVEGYSEHQQIIFEEDAPFGAMHWEAFAEKLSNITGLPLKKEYYVEQMDGTLSQRPFEKRSGNRRRGLIILAIPTAVSLAGALSYTYLGTPQAFLIAGFTTLCINFLLSFIYSYLHRQEMGDWGKNNFRLVIYVMSMIIPYIIIYLSFVLILNDFKWPLSNT